MQNCLVTGVAGFIGSSLARRLIELGAKVRGIDCFTDYYARNIKTRNLVELRDSAGFQFIEADLLNVNFTQLLDGIDVIFHQAAQAGVRASWGSSFEIYLNNNIFATQRLLEAAKDMPSLQKVVYASSSSIYGDAESYPTTEKVKPNPVSPYGVSKLAAEHLMTLYASQFGVPTVSLRYFTVFGPRQRPDMAFNKFISAALKGQQISIYGDGTQSRDFTFINDIVEGNILAAKRGRNGGVYNLGGGTQASVNQVLDMIASHLGNLQIQRFERVRGDALHTSADTSLARQELGYVPQVSLSEGIRRQIEWHESLG